jgi:hypothetical protein
LSGTANAAAPAGYKKQEKVTEIISQRSPLSAEAAFVFIGQYCTKSPDALCAVLP